MSGMPTRSAAARRSMMSRMHARPGRRPPGHVEQVHADAAASRRTACSIASGNAWQNRWSSRRVRRRRWRRRCAARAPAWPCGRERLQQRRLAGLSWIASGPAATSVSITADMSSMPARKRGSPKKPWSTATSSAARRGVEEAVQPVGGGHAPIIGTAVAGAVRGRITRPWSSPAPTSRSIARCPSTSCAPARCCASSARSSRPAARASTSPAWLAHSARPRCSSASFPGAPGRRGRRCWPTKGSPCAGSRSAASCARPRWCSSARAG